MNTQHAPGPWKVIRPLKNYVASEEGNIICKVHPYNARLIASAPELLEALKFAQSTLIEAVERWSNGEDCYQIALDKCKAAIAKAEGK